MYWCQFLNYLKHFLAFQYCNYTDTPVKSSDDTIYLPDTNYKYLNLQYDQYQVPI